MLIVDDGIFLPAVSVDSVKKYRLCYGALLFKNTIVGNFGLPKA
jgi:hypothetical protein